MIHVEPLLRKFRLEIKQISWRPCPAVMPSHFAQTSWRNQRWSLSGLPVVYPGEVVPDPVYRRQLQSILYFSFGPGVKILGKTGPGVNFQFRQ